MLRNVAPAWLPPVNLLTTPPPSYPVAKSRWEISASFEYKSFLFKHLPKIIVIKKAFCRSFWDFLETLFPAFVCHKKPPYSYSKKMQEIY